MKQELEQALDAAVKKLFDVEIVAELARTDEQFGDYSCNVAMKLAKELNKNPREIAQALAAELTKGQSPHIAKAEVAGPGFLNLTLSDSALLEQIKQKPARSLAEQTVVAEYSDPNPFKVLHAGHLYTSVVGDAIANLLENAGAKVHRVNFGGDVGLHVGKAMWAILQDLGGEDPGKLSEISKTERSEWMTKCYIDGTRAYEDDENAKAEIVELNKKVYQIQAEKDHDSPLAQIYWTCRDWSYQYFDEFYDRIGSHFEKYYPESQTAPLGLQTVKEHTPDVYQESQGAIVFDGEKYGLHTRVFINSEGLPTYEAKDVGLIMHKWQDYHYDLSVYITGDEQEQYLAVVMKSIEQFAPELTAGVKHLTHGLVKLAGGVKMSSRKGNILRAVDVLDSAAEASRAISGKDDESVTLGAVKYAFLKNRLGGDIIYDPAESVSLEGNSGPYLQYALVRAKSILSKAKPKADLEKVKLQADERMLARKLGEYAEVVDAATAELMPHLICTYLYELAQTFNRFYERNRVIGDEREVLRVGLVQSYAGILEQGLNLLGIPTPDKM